MKKSSLFIGLVILMIIAIAISLASFVPAIVSDINEENAYHQSHETTGDR